jgi:hypothetical protein
LPRLQADQQVIAGRLGVPLARFLPEIPTGAFREQRHGAVLGMTEIPDERNL